MTKIIHWIELIKEDVNDEESMMLSYFSKQLQIHFKLLILLGVPFLIYLLSSADKMN